MKQQMTMVELAATVKEHEEIKNDFLAETNGLQTFSDVDGELKIRRKSEVYDMIGSGLTSNAHSQIASRLKIPMVYYKRLLDKYPDMLAININNLFHNEPENRMLRLLNGKVRAFLSDKYRIIDNYETLSHIMPILTEYPDMKIESCAVTEDKMYLQCILHEMTGTLSTGDIVKSGITISNSEVGNGAFKISPMIMVMYCTNGIISNRAIRKYHVGSKQGSEDLNWEILSNETRNLTNAAFFSQMKDVVKHSLQEVDFQRRIGEINEAQMHKISARKLEGKITAVSKKYGIPDAHGEAIIEQLINGKEGLTRFGVSQAITNIANNVDDYDLNISMQSAGGDIIEMGNSAFDSMVKRLSK
jgi:hypothetical protein